MREDDDGGLGRRSFARVRVKAPARVRPLDAEEMRSLARELEVSPSYRETLGVGAASDDQSGESAGWEKLALRTVLERLDGLEALVGRIAEALEIDVAASPGWILGETADLSGGGVGLRLPVSLPIGKPLEIELTLPGKKTGHVRIGGEVVCHVPADGQDVPVGRHHLGVKFVAIHEADREAIIHHTFVEQRALIREMRREEQDDDQS